MSQRSKILKKIIPAVLYALGILGLAYIKLMLNNLLPAVFTYIDILMLFFVIAIMRGAGGGVVWFAFGVYLIEDILTSQHFGIELFAGVFTILGIFWFFEEVFTNLSIWIAGILTLFGMFVFRSLYCIGILFSGLLLENGFIFSMGLMKQFGMEMLCTAILAIPLYAVFIKIGNMFTREKIKYS